MWESLGTVRDLGRLQQIASVLVAYGFSDVVRRIGLAGALERAGRMLHWQDPEALAHMPPPVRVRRAPWTRRIIPMSLRQSATRRSRWTPPLG